MGFLDALSALCQAPAIDNSEILSRQANMALLRESFENDSVENRAELYDVLAASGFDVYYDENGNLIADRLPDTASNDAQLVTQNGITTLAKAMENSEMELATRDRVTSISFDPEDAAEYENRYFSMDFRDPAEDGSNISFLRIVNARSRELVFPNFPAGGSPGPGITSNKFKQFILMQMSISSQERMQIVEMASDFQALFFDERAQIMRLSGILKNSIDNPWTMNMIFLWDNLMRGTKLAEMGNICQLYIDGELYSGYPFNFSRSKSAGNDAVVSFSMDFLIRERLLVSGYGGIEYRRAK